MADLINNSINLVRQTNRCLDMIFCSLLALGVMGFYETCSILIAHDWALALAMLFLLIITFATFTLPSNPKQNSKWEEQSFKIRIAALGMTGLAPFLFWQVRGYGGYYFILSGMLAIISACWYALELLNFIELIFAAEAKARFFRSIKLTRVLISYAILSPVFAFSFFIAGRLLRPPAIPIRSLVLIWHELPLFLRFPVGFATIISLLSLLWLLWESRYMVDFVIPRDNE